MAENDNKITFPYGLRFLAVTLSGLCSMGALLFSLPLQALPITLNYDYQQNTSLVPAAFGY